MSLRISDPNFAEIARQEGYQYQQEVLDLLRRDKPRPPPDIIYHSDCALSQKIWKENHGKKRINGHSPEYIGEAFDLDVDRLFPPEGLTLYIGDPWQRLDRKGVVLLDYEYGPVALFQAEKPFFMSMLRARMKAVVNNHERKKVEGDYVSDFIDDRLREMEELARRADAAKLQDIPSLAPDFTRWREIVEKERTRQIDLVEEKELYATDDRIEDLWYLGLHGERIIDIYDWETQLKREYERYKNSLPHDWSDKEKQLALKSKRRGLIESIRLKKTAKYAEPTEAMFPFTPFRANSFDSLVAYYSISSYVFPELTDNEMYSYWQEIYRVLKEGGEAFIAPLFSGSEDIMEETLRRFQEEHPDFYYGFEENEEVNNYDPDMLYICKMPKALDS